MPNRTYNSSSVPSFGAALTSATIRNEFGAVSTGFTDIEAEIDAKGTVFSVTAGNGLTQSGVATANPTLDVVSHAGTAGSVGTLVVGANSVGVALGRTSTTAMPGDVAIPDASTFLSSTITDGDTTHAPDGNSVFDALAGKQASSGNLNSLAAMSTAQVATLGSANLQTISALTTDQVQSLSTAGIAGLTTAQIGALTRTDLASTWTAQQTFKELKDTVYNITDGAAFEIDPANGNIQTVTLGASRSPAATNFEAGQCILLGVDDGTAYTVTWPSVQWLKSGGTAIAPALATSGYTWIILFKQGTTLFGSLVGSN